MFFEIKKSQKENRQKDAAINFYYQSYLILLFSLFRIMIFLV